MACSDPPFRDWVRVRNKSVLELSVENADASHFLWAIDGVEQTSPPVFPMTVRLPHFYHFVVVARRQGKAPVVRGSLTRPDDTPHGTAYCHTTSGANGKTSIVTITVDVSKP